MNRTDRVLWLPSNKTREGETQ